MLRDEQRPRGRTTLQVKPLLLLLLFAFSAVALPLQHLAAPQPPPTPSSFTNSLGGWWECDSGITLNGFSRVSFWNSRYNPPNSFAADTGQTAAQMPTYTTYSGDPIPSITTLTTTGGYLNHTSLALAISNRMTVVLVCRMPSSPDNGGIVFGASANDVGSSFVAKWFSDSSLEFSGPASMTRVAGSAPVSTFLIITVRVSPTLNSTLRINRAQIASGGLASAATALPVPFRLGAGGDDEAGAFNQQTVIVYGLALWKTDLDDNCIDGIERYFLDHFSACNH